MAYVSYLPHLAGNTMVNWYGQPINQTNQQSSAKGSYGGLDPGTISHQPFMDYANQIRTTATNPAMAQQTNNYASQLMNTAFDPQKALYDRNLQQMQDQVRASLAARGLNSSAAGAGIENEALGNFNLDWQNQQLNRQLSAVNPYLSLANNPLNQMTQGAQAYNMLGNTAQGIAQAGFTNAGNLGAAQYHAPSINVSSPSTSAYSPMSAPVDYTSLWRQQNLAQSQAAQAANAAMNQNYNNFMANSYMDSTNTRRPTTNYFTPSNNLSYFGGY